jgi:lysophospholipase L1-like esterase
MQQLIEISMENDRKVFVLGITRVIDVKTSPVAWSKIRFYKNEWIETYDKALEQVSRRNNVKFIPVFDLLDDEDLDDGVHPDEKGHEKIFRRVLENLNLKD